MRILGLDITSRAVRGALVRSTLRKADVEALVEAPIGDDGAQGVAAAIRQAIDQLDRPPDSVIAALDGDEVSLRALEMPAGAARKIADVLPFELEPLLPLDIAEMLVDHQIIARDATTLRVLAGAAPKQRVEARLALLEHASVAPRELAAGAASLDALGALLPSTAEDGDVTLVHLDLTSADVCVLEGGKCAFARTLSLGTDGEGRPTRALLDALVQTLASHRAGSSPPMPAPERVLVSGDFPSSEAAGDAVEAIGEALGVLAEPLPLGHVLAGSGAAADVEGDPRGGVGPALRFAKAVALAARPASRGHHINLRQGELASSPDLGELRQHTGLFVAAGVALVLGLGFMLGARYYGAVQERDDKRAQLEEVTETLFGHGTASAPDAQRMIDDASRPPDDPLPRFDAFAVLDALSGAIPDTVQHDTRSLRIKIDDQSNDGDLEISGTVQSIADRDNIVTQLGGNDCFEDIEPGPTSPAPDGAVNYRLSAKIRCPGAPPPAKKGRSARNDRNDRSDARGAR